MSYRPTKSGKSGIDIYSCAGKLLKSIAWDRGSIKGLGWSEDERLLVVGLDGTVRCYYGLQGDFTQFSLGREAEDLALALARTRASAAASMSRNDNGDGEEEEDWDGGFADTDRGCVLYVSKVDADRGSRRCRAWTVGRRP